MYKKAIMYIYHFDLYNIGTKIDVTKRIRNLHQTSRALDRSAQLPIHSYIHAASKHIYFTLFLKRKKPPSSQPTTASFSKKKKKKEKKDEKPILINE